MGSKPVLQHCAAFGDSVRRARHALDMTQERLAELAGLHRTHIQLIETGKREPRLGTILRLNEALGVNLINGVKAPPL
jgi:transcriptional regulator with XRE-family HTH domain